MVLLKEIFEALAEGDAKKVKNLVEQALTQGISPKEILDKALIPGMREVGEKFKKGEYFIPEVLVAAKAMNTGIDLLRPFFNQIEVEHAGKVLIGTVSGDIHDIGKNLVATMLRGAGFQIIDLGVDVSPEMFVEKAKSENVDIVAMSALLTTTMLSMKDTIYAIKEAGLRDKVKILVGGAPVTLKYAEKIGADGYAPDAATAVEKARELLGIT